MNYAARLTVICLALIVAIGCDALTVVRGTVRDTRCQPVADANVVINVGGNTWSGLTDSDGRFEKGITHGPTNSPLELVISKPGFEKLTVKLPASFQYNGLIFELKDAVGPAASEHTE